MRTLARARFVRVSARKARLVLDQIRGKSVGEALATLQYTPRAAAPRERAGRTAGRAGWRAGGFGCVGRHEGARRGPAEDHGGGQGRREAQASQVQGEEIEMGQKTHPIGFRLGATRTWSSRWFATKGYAGLLHEDVKIRRYIKDQLYHAGISKIDIERSANRAPITISTARPGITIGRKGSEVEKLK